MQIFFSVGEPSGDLHAAKLVTELRRRCPDIDCTGYGGPQMEQAGFRSLFRLTDLAVMGFIRVIPLLWKFIKLARQALQYFEAHRPDAVVLVDFPGFNWWIARKAKRLGIPVLYYLPPQLWGWAPWRIHRMRRFVDHVLCCLPFEYDWYRARGVSAELVGHPFFDEVAERQLAVGWAVPTNSENNGGHNPPYKTIAILPGSRGHEIAQNFSVQIDVMVNLHRLIPDARFLVACYKESQRQMCEERLIDAGVVLPVELHVGRTSEIIEAADVCLMVSGSVSLEVLARTTPAVVLYRTNWFFNFLRSMMMTCKYISLPNLIADREVMPEFVSSGNQSDIAATLTDILHRWLTDATERQRVVDQLQALKERVAIPGATQRAAQALLSHLPEPSARCAA